MVRLLLFIIVCCITAPSSSFAKCTCPILNSAGSIYTVAYIYTQPKNLISLTANKNNPPENDLFPDPTLKRKAKWAKWLGIGALIGLIIPGVNLLSLPAAITSLILGGQVRRQTIQSQYLKDVDKGKLASTVTIVFLAAVLVISLLVISLGNRGVR